MVGLRTMKIAVVTGFYSEGMGYTENCLSKSLASLGHEVHVVTSNYNVYGTSPEYDATYKTFLGPADQGVRSFNVDGYFVHRLQSSLIGGYVWIKGLATKIRTIAPDIVHCTEVASLQSFLLAAIKPLATFKYFAETHQHLSVVKPYLKASNGFWFKKTSYRLTRTIPTFLASLAVEKCYAIAPDCAHVARTFYGVPGAKIKLQSLGTDTDLFRPATSSDELSARHALRRDFGYEEEDVVCIYTGRLSTDKNPLLLAQAVGQLLKLGGNFHSLFVGEGPQRAEILRYRNSTVVPFRKHADLAKLYRVADIAIWPRQESMSMLDAAACMLPLIVSDAIGESERVRSSGLTYIENNAEDLARAILALSSREQRVILGARGRAKMIESFSWKAIAKKVEADYVATRVSG